MTERLLQFIWQFQYFNRNELRTMAGDPVMVVYPGNPNTHQGPDFLEAKIKIGDALWIGNVELHIFSSDWRKHAHSVDPNYDNVILHVVWHVDDEENSLDMPTIQLEDRIHKLLLHQYEAWMNSRSFIPCAQYIHMTDDLIWISWKERLLIERIERKSAQAHQLLIENRFHWEETFWWMLARNFGLSVNAEAFEEIARSLPFSLLLKHKNQIHQLEALLFGQAGQLEGNFSDKYPQMLQKEYAFYRRKYALQRIRLPIHLLRMRPKSFPAVRLAQLAMLIHRSSHLFNTILEASDIDRLREIFMVTANDYWHYHYDFDHAAGYQPKNLGEQMINNIIINTVAPILAAYGRMHNAETYLQKAINWLIQLPAEKNAVSMQFGRLQVKSQTAGDTQSLIELKTQYCNKKRCLDCSVGAAIIKWSWKPPFRREH